MGADTRLRLDHGLGERESNHADASQSALAPPGERKEARDLLAEVSAWCPEGFDTADLQESKALLEERV